MRRGPAAGRLVEKAPSPGAAARGLCCGVKKGARDTGDGMACTHGSVWPSLDDAIARLEHNDPGRQCSDYNA